MTKLGANLLLGLLALFAVTASEAPGAGPIPGIEANLPLYRPADRLSGTIMMTGSDTMAHLAGGWGDNFRQYHPDVDVQISIQGAANAVPAVINGEATFGLLSRSITSAEVKEFRDKLGYDPTVLTPSLERMAIVVHKDNPIKSLTGAQLQAIFGKQSSGQMQVHTWGDLGVTGPLASQAISVHGRADNTGSTVYFQQAVLGGSEFDDGMERQPANMNLVREIGSNPAAIGYVGMMYLNRSVQAVPLVNPATGKAVAIDSVEADEGLYPLMRPLHLVVNHKPGTTMPKLQSEFLKYVFSRLGQEDVVKGGFQPVPSDRARIALDGVGVREVN